jgi:hypothetical protein
MKQHAVTQTYTQDSISYYTTTSISTQGQKTKRSHIQHRTRTMTSQIVFSRRTWDTSTRRYPTLAFIEKYTQKVDSLDLSGPSYDWYAPSCSFHDTDGTVYEGGVKIWDWMRQLFGQFKSVQHEITNVLLITPSGDPSDPEASGPDTVLLEAVTNFGLNGEGLGDDNIAARRKFMFKVGLSETEGQGTDRLQILEAKVWWDRTALLAKLMEKKAT